MELVAPSRHPSPAPLSRSIISSECLEKSLYAKESKNVITYFLYGLQAATNLRKGGTNFPLHLPSHMISFIRLITSLVLASSKKTTVSILNFRFSNAASVASSKHFMTSFSVVPP